MIINWLGMSCFKIQTKEATIIINPYQDKCGLKMPKNKADLVLVSDREDPLANNTQRLSGDFTLLDCPGEYEVKEVFISGLNAGKEDQAQKSIFYLKTEKISLGFLGMLNHSLSSEQLETMEGVDILFLPVTSLTGERQSKIISQIEPRIIIPMYYKIPKAKEKLENLDSFLKEIGLKNPETLDKLKITNKELPEEETKVIILKNE